MGWLLGNTREQKLQYLPTSWSTARKTDSKEARLVEDDDAMRKKAGTFWVHREGTSEKDSGQRIVL